MKLTCKEPFFIFKIKVRIMRISDFAKRCIYQIRLLMLPKRVRQRQKAFDAIIEKTVSQHEQQIVDEIVNTIEQTEPHA